MQVEKGKFYFQSENSKFANF